MMPGNEQAHGRTTQTKLERWLEFLEQEVWPTIPEEQLGRTLSREEEDKLLGYGQENT
jgi:hypothetical protein